MADDPLDDTLAECPDVAFPFGFGAPLTADRRASMRTLIAVALTLLAAGARADPSSCYSVMDPDRRAFCLATSQGQTSYCYSIQAADRRNLCLAIAGGQKSFCYSIQSPDLRNECLAYSR